MSTRKLAVAGQFYPDDENEILRYINHFNDVLEKNNIQKQQKIEPKAIIVPHAGYIYSGFTANMGYKEIPKNVKNIIVIGPSHKFAFEGASVALYDSYPTPLGSLDINKAISQRLIDEFSFFTFNEQVHCEHSTETQLPFIKYYLPDVNVVEIVYGHIDFIDIAKVIESLLKDEGNFIVISTDLSHFYDLNTANKLDNICLSAILNKDIDIKENGCEACGMIGVKAILEIANRQNFDISILDYRTSADASRDTNRVVGYTSAIIGKKI